MGKDAYLLFVFDKLINVVSKTHTPTPNADYKYLLLGVKEFTCRGVK